MFFLNITGGINAWTILQLACCCCSHIPLILTLRFLPNISSVGLGGEIRPVSRGTTG
jgi:hypothetical protein